MQTARGFTPRMVRKPYMFTGKELGRGLRDLHAEGGPPEAIEVIEKELRERAEVATICEMIKEKQIDGPLALSIYLWPEGDWPQV